MSPPSLFKSMTALLLLLLCACGERTLSTTAAPPEFTRESAEAYALVPIGGALIISDKGVIHEVPLRRMPDGSVEFGGYRKFTSADAKNFHQYHRLHIGGRNVRINFFSQDQLLVKFPPEWSGVAIAVHTAEGGKTFPDARLQILWPTDSGRRFHDDFSKDSAKAIRGL